MAKSKVDRYVKVVKHYKHDKPYYHVKLFSENPDEQPLGTHKQFPLRYETFNRWLLILMLTRLPNVWNAE